MAYYLFAFGELKPSELSMDPSSLTGTLVSGNITTEALSSFYPVRYVMENWRFSGARDSGARESARKEQSFFCSRGRWCSTSYNVYISRAGLVSGTAGDAFNFYSPGKRHENIEVQTISTSAYVVPTVHEVQNCTVSNSLALSLYPSEG